jgi:signal transduction histidine kinase
MFYSLRFGILMAMLAVAAVAITTVTIFVGITTRAQFSRYVETGRELRQQRFERAIVEWVDPSRTIPDLESLSSIVFLTEDSQPEPGSFRIRMLEDVGVIEAVDTENNSIVEGESIVLEIAPNGEMLIYRGQEVIGSMFIDPVSDLELQLAQDDFMEAINWTLVVTSFVAGVAAITLTVILSRRILHPVAALTLAARRMESGDLDQRVKVHASGEIEELAHAFNAMAEALSRTEALRRNMVSDIAHELRTPLTNIRGYLEALQDGVLEPDRYTIDMLHDETLLLNRLIQDLQELALAESGALQYEPQELELDLLIEQTIAASQASAKQKQITLNMQLPDELPVVIADSRRVAQVLRNLINNAITYTPADGIIQITAEIFPNEIEISISDSGEGIDAEHLPYLFERFYRADPSRSRVTGGAGLGLAIVKNLIEAQGGRVQVNSIKGKGATFSFTLPRLISIH